MKNILMIIAPEGFRDEEYFDTREELEKAGHKVTAASTTTGECVGKLGGKALCDTTIDAVAAADFDAIVFVGGRGCEIYFENERALTLAREFANAGKVTSAICLAPMILARAGVLMNKRATITKGEEDNMESFGARYSGEQVTVDGNIVTADGPASSRAFGRMIATMVE